MTNTKQNTQPSSCVDAPGVFDISQNAGSHLPDDHPLRKTELLYLADELVCSGRATVAEAARLVGVSRQRLHNHYGSVIGPPKRQLLLERLWRAMVRGHDRKMAKFNAEWMKEHQS